MADVNSRILGRITRDQIPVRVNAQRNPEYAALFEELKRIMKTKQPGIRFQVVDKKDGIRWREAMRSLARTDHLALTSALTYEPGIVVKGKKSEDIFVLNLALSNKPTDDEDEEKMPVVIDDDGDEEDGDETEEEVDEEEDDGDEEDSEDEEDDEEDEEPVRPARRSVVTPPVKKRR